MRAVSAARVAAGLLFASSFLGGPTTHRAQAQTAPSLAGLQGRALASGVAVAYKPENLLPIASPVDLSAPDALATIASGPSTFARASVADPGDLLANPDALLALAGLPGYQPGTIPAYPFRISASSGVGQPTAESNPAPGLNARVSADSTGSTAQAVMPGLAAPGIATAGSITSTSSTTTDGATVTVRARTQVSNFNLLGVFTIDSLVTDVSATSDGEKTDVKGGTTITGAAFMGQAVTVDANGIQGGIKPLVDALGTAGIHITLAAPEAQEGKTAGQLTAAGLQILIDSAPAKPVLGQIPGLVPPLDVPGVEDAIALTQVRHLQYIDIGRGQVSLAARGKFASPPAEDIDLGSDVLPAPATVGAANLVGDTTPLAATPLPRAGRTPQPLAATEPASSTTLAAGIGALALLALLAQPFFGHRLARFADALLAPGATGSCPQEER